MPFRTRRLTVIVAAGAACATLLVAVLEPLRFAYFRPGVEVAIATAVTLIGLLAAGLLVARFHRSRRLQDLALAASLAILTATNFLFSAIPLAFDAFDSQFAAWAPFAGRMLGAVVFAASVAVPDRTIGDPRKASKLMLAGSLAAIGVVGAVVAALAPGWPGPLEDAVSATESAEIVISSEPVRLVALALMCGLYTIAAIGFVGRAERTGDELMGWFALASPLAAFAAVNYFLFPSLYPGWVYTGDLLRLGFYLMLLVGAAREIAAWQRELISAAASGERRRIARELHDGLAQELAFIVGQTRSLTEQTGDAGPFGNIANAAERALDESRTAIAALSRSEDEPLDSVLAQAAEDVAGRVGTHVRFDLTSGVTVAGDVQEDLARIVREAVTNAARHGHARNVTVTMSNTDGILVRIADDGDGFDPAAPRRRGFGMTSMRERAQSRGGEMNVRSEPGKGTEVEVRIP